MRHTDVLLDKDARVAWEANVKNRKGENRFDGKLVLETPEKKRPAAEVVKRCEERAG